jgi:hypothetical protein
MIPSNTAATIPRRLDPVRRSGWRPGPWACALVIAWLTLLAVPLSALYFASYDPAAAESASAQPLKAWMPIYQPII